MGREDEGSDLWEWETPRGLFLGSQKVAKCVGGCVGGKSDRFEKEVLSGFRTSFWT